MQLLKHKHIIYHIEAHDLEIQNTVFPRFSVPARVSALPSDKRPLQISHDFDQNDGEPGLILNQLTSKSLGLFFY